MSWDTEFYAAAMADSDFSSGITALAFEFKSDGVAPFSTYQLISGLATSDLSGTSPEGEHLVQLTVWADSPTEAKQLAQYAIEGIKALNVSGIYQRSLGRDPDEEVFGFAVDFNIWFQTP
jgi:hypothetical protein